MLLSLLNLMPLTTAALPLARRCIISTHQTQTLTCNFSGYKIYPGHGIRFIRSDSKTFNFVNTKSAALFLAKKNPRKISWTVVYRRVHKKGIVEEEKRRRTRRTQKLQRAIVGASLEAIKAKRTQTKEVRQAQRDAALREIKDRKKKEAKAVADKKAAAEKKANKAKSAGSKAASKAAVKRQGKQARAAPKPVVGGKR